LRILTVLTIKGGVTMNQARMNMRNFLCGLTVTEVLEVRRGRECPDQISYIDEWLHELCEEFNGGPCLTATMSKTVKLLGCGLVLKIGTRVALTAATNLPYVPIKMFGQPMDARTDWLGGYDDSILLDAGDYEDLEDWSDEDAETLRNADNELCDICGHVGPAEDFEGMLCYDCYHMV
jgi:hypothetical protein